MKLIIKIAFLFMLTQASFAETLYGIGMLQKYHAPIKHAVYVQMATFKQQHAAVQYQSHLRQKTKVPVVVKSAHGYYKVIAGPFKNQASLNQFSNAVNPKAPIVPVRKKVKQAVKIAPQPKPIDAQYPSVEQDSSASFQPFFTLPAVLTGPKEFKPVSPWTRIATLSVGPSWNNYGSTQTFYLQPAIQKTYTADNEGQIIANGELYLSWQRTLTPNVFWQIGGVLAESYNTTLTGDIWEDADPDFDNFSYQYKVNHMHLGVKSKLVFEIEQAFQPYVSAALAIGSNYSYGYNVTAKLDEEVPAPLFTSRGVTALTYTLGLGAQKAINTNWALGLGYEFGDWGRSSLGAAPGQTLNGGLVLNQLYNHQVQLSFSYTPNE